MQSTAGPNALGSADVVALAGIVVTALVALAGFLLTQPWDRRERFGGR